MEAHPLAFLPAADFPAGLLRPDYGQTVAWYSPSASNDPPAGVVVSDWYSENEIPLASMLAMVSVPVMNEPTVVVQLADPSPAIAIDAASRGSLRSIVPGCWSELGRESVIRASPHPSEERGSAQVWVPVPRKR